MNRDTICVQGGYTPGNGEPRQVPISSLVAYLKVVDWIMGTWRGSPLPGV